MRRVIGVLIAGVLLASQSEYESARRKADLIENDQAKPGSTVSFSVAEANAYAREEARKEVGDGVRNTKVWFGNGTASGSATIDFVKVQTARGKPPGMLMRLMLEGEKDVQVTVRVESRARQAKIDVDEVYINGLGIPKSAVNMLIEYYVMPRYPEAKIGQWFELRHRVDSIGVTPAGVALKFKP